MSLWADYINECGILHIIEKDYGFITYHLDSPKVVINDCYIAPEFRKNRKASALVDEVCAFGREYGCEYISCLVHKESLCADDTIVGLQRYGFVMQKEDESYKIFNKLLWE